MTITSQVYSTLYAYGPMTYRQLVECLGKDSHLINGAIYNLKRRGAVMTVSGSRPFRFSVARPFERVLCTCSSFKRWGTHAWDCPAEARHPQRASA